MVGQHKDSSGQEWRLDTGKVHGMTALAILVGCLGLFGFGWMSYLVGAAQAFSVRVSPEQALIAIVLVLGIGFGIAVVTVILFLMHEWCHGLAFRAMGATPRYGAKMLAWFFPILYATAPGGWLTRWQYSVVLFAPTVAVNLLGIALLVVLGSWSWVLVPPLATHLGGCVGDWWVAGVVLRLPEGTRVEDTEHGFRYQPY